MKIILIIVSCFFLSWILFNIYRNKWKISLSDGIGIFGILLAFMAVWYVLPNSDYIDTGRNVKIIYNSNYKDLCYPMDSLNHKLNSLKLSIKAINTSESNIFDLNFEIWAEILCANNKIPFTDYNINSVLLCNYHYNTMHPNDTISEIDILSCLDKREPLLFLFFSPECNLSTAELKQVSITKNDPLGITYDSTCRTSNLSIRNIYLEHISKKDKDRSLNLQICLVGKKFTGYVGLLLKIFLKYEINNNTIIDCYYGGIGYSTSLSNELGRVNPVYPYIFDFLNSMPISVSKRNSYKTYRIGNHSDNVEFAIPISTNIMTIYPMAAESEEGLKGTFWVPKELMKNSKISMEPPKRK